MEKKTSESYKKEVLEKYKKEKGGEMSVYLLEPTRKNIRDACIHLLNSRNGKNDVITLNHFFQFKEAEDHLRVIERFDADKFRPIVNFLIGETHSTSDKNIELISWLIDFRPRPRQEYLKTNYLDPNKDGKVNETQVKAVDNKKEIIVDVEEEIDNRKQKKTFTFSITIVFVVVCLIMVVAKSGMFGGEVMTEDNKCMTWVKTHYDEVSCTKKYSTKVEPLDLIKLTNFKKVEASITTRFFDEETNKPLIWYYKNKKGEIEYYTAPGLHPVNGETLRKITEGVIEKYVPLYSSKKTSFLE